MRSDGRHGETRVFHDFLNRFNLAFLVVIDRETCFLCLEIHLDGTGLYTR